jgi:peptidoglycan pentaglycine glycine transferase (the first glycine)
MPELTAAGWEDFLQGCENPHLLQTAAWGELKSAFGWQPLRIAVHPGNSTATGAQVLFRRLPLGFSLAYLPKGPLAPAWDEETPDKYSWPQLWTEIDQACRRRRAIFLLAEPEGWVGGKLLPYDHPGFQPGLHAIQPRRSLLVDLAGSDEQLLGRMKQKTRYNIRLAPRKGISVRPSDDLAAFGRLMQTTGRRDGFGVHTEAYYRRAYELFHPRGECELLLAYFEDQPVGGLLVFARGRRAWYLYGASSDEHRERMPAYLLQWEALQWARRHGCQEYDLWGVPDEDEDTLEAGFTARSDGLWGVYRFKRGFGGRLVRTPEPQERVYLPALHRLYRLWLTRQGGVPG